MGLITQHVFLLCQWLKRFSRRRDDRFFIDIGESVEEVLPDRNRRQYVRFPVRLAILYGEEMLLNVDAFILDVNRGEVFIHSEHPLLKGSMIHLHFYIPPEEKLLGAFEGEVVKVNRFSGYPRGMHVQLFGYSADDMDRLEAYLEERRQLLNVVA